MNRHKIMADVATVTAQLNQEYAEGMATDIETVRKQITGLMSAYEDLNRCTTCGRVNTGQHDITAEGVTCHHCHNDKREYVVAWGLGYDPTEPKLYYNWMFKDEIDFFDSDMEEINELKIGSATQLSVCIGKIVFIMRTK